MADKRMYLKGERLRQFREARDWTQEDLAERSGVNRAVISRVERGEKRRILSDHLLMLARALRIRPEQLVEHPPPLPEDEQAAPEVSVMLKLIRDMTDSERAEIWDAIEYTLWKRRKQNGDLDGTDHPASARADGDNTSSTP
jgi:transcriptional regulator with XRE-family HTH domain